MAVGCARATHGTAASGLATRVADVPRVNVKKLVRALIFAAACLATAWWLLREAPEQQRDSAAIAPQSEALPVRAAEAGAHAARDNELVTDVPSAAPAAADESRAVPVTDAGGRVEPIPMIEGITLPGGMWNLHAAMERESRDFE